MPDASYINRASPADHKAMLLLHDCMGQDPVTWVSNRILGSALDITEGAVRTRLRRLERLGLITIDYEPNRRIVAFTDKGQRELEHHCLEQGVKAVNEAV